MVYTQKSFFQYVFDSSALINIERQGLMTHLRRRRFEVILPEKVSIEVKTPGFPLHTFINNHPSMVTMLTSAEEEQYLQIRGQSGIHDGEAAAITLALSRGLPLVIDESQKRGRGKAENHDIRCLTSQGFIQGA